VGIWRWNSSGVSSKGCEGRLEALGSMGAGLGGVVRKGGAECGGVGWELRIELMLL
jgi:hypothetical protein